MNVVLGIDPGSISIGWVFVNVLDGSLVDHGSFKANSTLDFEARRSVIRIHISELFAKYNNISFLAIEDPMSKNFGVAKKLCVIKTMVEEAAALLGIEYVAIHPMTWQAIIRKTVPGLKDLKSKELSHEAARLKVGLDLPQDEADAFWVAYSALQKWVSA